MIDPTLDYKTLIEKVKNELKRASMERNHPMHLVILGTSFNNKPEMRHVVWRKFNLNENRGEVYTDIRSNKIKQIRQQPIAQLLFYHLEEKCQIKVNVEIIIHHNNELALNSYENLERGQEAYNTMGAPGTEKEKLKETTSFRNVFDASNFTVLEMDFLEMEVLQLNQPNHLRFSYNCKKNIFKWLVP